MRRHCCRIYARRTDVRNIKFILPQFTLICIIITFTVNQTINRTLLFSILLLFGQTIYAATQTQKMPLRVVTELFPPFQLPDANRKLEGIAVEKVQLALDLADLDVKIEMLPWARAYKLAQERPNILIFSLVRNPEREKQFIWIAKLDSSLTWMYKLKSNSQLDVSSLDYIGDTLIGVERSDVAANYISEYVSKKHLIVSTNTLDNVRMLSSGRVDMVPTNDVQLEYYCKKIGCKVTDFSKLFKLDGISPMLYLAANPNTIPDIILKLQTEFSKLQQTN